MVIRLATEDRLDALNPVPTSLLKAPDIFNRGATAKKNVSAKRRTHACAYVRV